MTWLEIKQAVKKAGVRDEDEILAIECEIRDGDGRLHAMTQGDFMRLKEKPSETADRDASGCAC
jgi:hypothetical protein